MFSKYCPVCILQCDFVKRIEVNLHSEAQFWKKILEVFKSLKEVDFKWDTIPRECFSTLQSLVSGFFLSLCWAAQVCTHPRASVLASI